MRNLKVRNRHAQLLTTLRQHGSLSVAELAALMDVSAETIRRDAALLEETGEVVKLHGAVSMPHNMVEASFERRMREFTPAKLAIARAAISMVRDGDSLVIDTGTTTIFFARELRARRNLTVITNCTEIARTLSDVPGNRVMLTGGEIEADSGATYGVTATEFVSRFRVAHAFLSISALDATSGPMDATPQEADFARAAMASATHRVILADASKFGTAAFVRVCSFADVEVIVTEAAPPTEFVSVLARNNTRLVIAG
jgi:DeoR family transcriptional regulator, glycerol-3-phosphate regulon repressor